MANQFLRYDGILRRRTHPTQVHYLKAEEANQL